MVECNKKPAYVKKLNIFENNWGRFLKKTQIFTKKKLCTSSTFVHLVPPVQVLKKVPEIWLNPDSFPSPQKIINFMRPSQSTDGTAVRAQIYSPKFTADPIY